MTIQTSNSSGRIRLTAATTFFVDATGSDSNTGLATGSTGAFATLQGALNAIQSRYDLNGFAVAIKTTTSGSFAPFAVYGPFVGDSATLSTYGSVSIIGSPDLVITAATNASPTVLTAAGHDYVNNDHVVISGAIGNTAINGAFKVANANTGAGTFTLVNEQSAAAINGNGIYTASSATVAAPSRVTISGTSGGNGAAIIARNGANLTIKGFKISSSEGLLCIASTDSVLALGKNQYDAPTGSVTQIWVTQTSRVYQIDNYSISGGTYNFVQASHVGAYRQTGCKGTFIANVTYDSSTGFLYSISDAEIVTTQSPGGIPWDTNGFTITGKKYTVSENGVFQSEGVTPPAQSAVPGSINGAVFLTDFTDGTPWTSYTPTITSQTGTITSTTINSASYKTIGKTVFVDIDFTITNNGTGATHVLATLPTSPAALISGKIFTLAGWEIAVSGKMLICALGYSANTTGVTIGNYDNTYPGATNARIVFSGCYEAA